MVVVARAGGRGMNAEDAIQQMIDLNWGVDWSELPREAEGHVEQASIHLSKARDIADRERGEQ